MSVLKYLTAFAGMLLLTTLVYQSPALCEETAKTKKTQKAPEAKDGANLNEKKPPTPGGGDGVGLNKPEPSESSKAELKKAEDKKPAAPKH